MPAPRAMRSPARAPVRRPEAGRRAGRRRRPRSSRRGAGCESPRFRAAHRTPRASLRCPSPRGRREPTRTARRVRRRYRRARTDHGGNRRPCRPRADRRTALVGGEGGDDDRQRARGQQRPERALQRTARDEQLDGRRDRAQARDDAEARNPDREHPPLAEDVAERAPTRISEPSVSRYAFETHCWPASPPPRSLRIAGSATLTAVASSPATNEPMIAATSASCLRRSGVLGEGDGATPGAC